ncbi:transglycosylase family protein [Streptomyces carpinensis]|uniref:Transglycosylase family protein n=1 Tax=Streptomyces carpinensis TaxID=66369 RepID=A0ABV1W453_9ACTN|nr:transglycosylase family protein [Streptomyces carpinensis]
MLSGNGRHRRPRQAPALLVTAGVTGSAIAIPLLGATGANAADGTTWDKVAQCESGGSWSADNGNGYYGGLQLTQDDWEKYGGLDFAPSADQASRSQQIAVAEKILADRGPGAWPTCGLLSGLTKDSGAADVDTGLGGGSSSDTGSSGSRDSSGSSGKSGSSEDSGGSGVDDPGLSDASQGTSNSPGSSDSSAGRGHSAGSPDSSDSSESAPNSSADPSAESSTKPSTSDTSPGKADDSAKSDTSPGSGADESGSPSGPPSAPAGSNRDDSDNPGQTVGSSALVDTGSLGTGRHRGGSAAEDAAEGSTAAGGRHASRGGGDAHTASADSYTVRTGDSLASIADSLGVDGGWHALYDANQGAIGSDPNHIVAGQSLDVPVENAQN